MGQIHKIGHEYYIEFYARGLLYQQKAGDDYQAAIKMLESVESKIQAGEMSTIVRDVDWDIFVKTFLNEAKEKHTFKTFDRYERTIEYFQKFIKTTFPKFNKLSEVTPAVVENFRSYMIHQSKIKARIINFTLILFEDVLFYAVKLGYLNDHPMVHTKWVEHKTSLKNLYIDEDKLISMKHEFSKQDAIVLEVLVLTGLSLNELNKISWEQVDFDRNCIKIMDEDFKASRVKPRLIPLALPVYEILVAQGKNILKSRSDGLKEINHFLIRNSFAYFALKQGIRLTDLYLMMGLDDVLKVMRYFEWLPRRLV